MAIVETSVIVKAAAPAIFKAATERVEKAVRGPAKQIAIKALAALSSYQDYLDETNERVSTFKTFANPTQPVSVLDHFVTAEFEQYNKNTKSITQDDLIQKLLRPSRFVISATAGYGKSMVMRYMALSLYENPTGRIPLFMELRHLNRISAPNLLNYIHSQYKRVSEIQIEALYQGLRAGSFVLLLDGFDELNHELRPIIEGQIIDLTREYPQCSIVVSGRPDDRFNSWRSFTTYKILPMSKVRVVELLHKLDYDSGTKKRFISKINKGLYETHESFLSTPLLAILMLLTYEQNANIPDKIHLFYAKAFETLFHKHDALKEQYDRSRKSSLQVDEFERVFSVFCLKTYVLEKTEFTKVEILKSLRDALKYENQDVSSDNYLFDVEEAVCLVMREGTSYFFVHRSFQEYFTALFLANCPEETRDEFIDQVASRYWDNVLPMLFDMASTQIEPSWVLRNTDVYLSKVDINKPDRMNPEMARFGAITFFKTKNGFHVMSYGQGPFAKYIGIMRRFYKSEFLSAPPISFEKIENFGIQNWDNLVFEHENSSGSGESFYTTRSVLLENVPNEILESSGLLSLAKFEYGVIKKIKGQINSDQAAKNSFLNKLFNERK